MENKEEIKLKIQELIDGTLPERERHYVLEAIDKDAGLASYYNLMKEIDHSLSDLDLHHPSGEFTPKVMSSLHCPQAKRFDIRSLLIFFGLIICAAVGLLYSSQASLELPGMAPVETNLPVVDEITIPGFTLPDAEVILTSFYFGILFLALIYLDRVILRQIFKSNRYGI